ncbi:MAG TPA: L-histidine N(alpha)-methyltransferase [Eudoraea sp.]|nr:L-histidine N(alpha)-methyltransferase [Eudoraea sp.]
MQEQISTSFTTQFEEDVYKGLTDFPKHLSSKYFYDAAGDKLFQDIMNMPEYYLTDCEHSILDRYKEAISDQFSSGNNEFNLIELGAGDGKKTKILLGHMAARNLPFTYIPIDISQNVLDQLQRSIHKELPQVNVAPLQGTYFEALKELTTLKYTRKVIMFLGSNIGNLLHHQAVVFLKKVQEFMQYDDLLFIGFDQKKHPQTVLNAYNDTAGITEAFNKNVLLRMNRELGANFDPSTFLHWEVYDPETGTARSFLVSKSPQSVYIQSLDLVIHFKEWETIQTEISQKYNEDVIRWLAEQSGLKIENEFTDASRYYKNVVFRKMLP